MLSFFKQLFDPADSDVDFEQLIENDAIVIDVRTSQEFKSGHLKESINIPLQQLAGRLDDIDKDKPIILCCATGSRSNSAKKALKTNGFSEVYNGGSWASLQEKIYT